MSRATDLTSTANDTKWDELRLAMYGLDDSPQFRCQTLAGHYSSADSEWFYHFREGGYDDIRFVDILISSQGQRTVVLSALRRIGLAGDETDQGFRVYGYTEPGQTISHF